MTFISLLVIYVFFSSSITLLFSCSCGLSEPLKDRRKIDRRKSSRESCPDRRVSHEYHKQQTISQPVY